MDAENDMRMQHTAPRHHDVELLAFTLWQERGTPLGTPEVDWFRAEAELKGQGSEVGPALAALAQKIGSALGSVAALVTADH
jgi:Protein of unknown function (DUF2934)